MDDVIWLAGLGLVWLAAMLIVAYLSLHPPVRTPIFISPGAMGTPQEDWRFESDGLRLSAWWVEVPGSNRVAILSHGYLMNRAELTPLAVTLYQHGWSSLLLDLRAHGRSQGRKSTLGLREANDVRAAIREVRARIPDAQIVLIGSSMGAVASVLAADAESGTVAGVIVDSGYSRMDQAILGWWRLLGGRWLSRLLWPTAVVAAPIAGFNPFRVDVAAALGRLTSTPVLLLYGDDDLIVPPEDALRNHRAAIPGTKMVRFPGCGHSEARWLRPVDYEAAVLTFLDDLPKELCANSGSGDVIKETSSTI